MAAHVSPSVSEGTFDWGPFRGDGRLQPVYVTDRGALFQGDCVALLRHVRDECIDTVFADPPFNLGKTYGAGVNDLREDDEYLGWCRQWIGECVRVLKPGGAFF